MFPPTVQETSVFSLLSPTGILVDFLRLLLLTGARWVWCHFWFAFPESSLVWSILSLQTVRGKFTTWNGPLILSYVLNLFSISYFRTLLEGSCHWQLHMPLCSVAQLCLTLCNPINCSPPGSTAHEVFQARILEWVAISYSRRAPWPRDATLVSWIARQVFYHWATREALKGP